MQAAKLSYWNNKWTDVFDFTPNKSGKEQNFSLNYEPSPFFVSSLRQMQQLIADVSKVKGHQIHSLKGKDSRFSSVL